MAACTRVCEETRRLISLRSWVERGVVLLFREVVVLALFVLRFVRNDGSRIGVVGFDLGDASQRCSLIGSV